MATETTLIHDSWIELGVSIKLPIDTQRFFSNPAEEALAFIVCDAHMIPQIIDGAYASNVAANALRNAFSKLAPKDLSYDPAYDLACSAGIIFMHPEHKPKPIIQAHHDTYKRILPVLALGFEAYDATTNLDSVVKFRQKITANTDMRKLGNRITQWLFAFRWDDSFNVKRKPDTETLTLF